MSLVSLSENKAVAVAGGMVTVKSVAFRLPNVFRLTPVGEVVLVAGVVVGRPVVGLVVVVVLMFGCSWTVAEVGGLMPKVRDLSRLICITATSTMTSDLDLSRSLTSFCARAIWSGVPRTTRAPSEGKD